MLFDIIKAIYHKNPINLKEININLCILLNKYLSLDKDNTEIIKNLLPYLFYINPIHYFFLLFVNIPKKTYIPFLKKIEKKEEILPKYVDKLCYIMNWSKKEYMFNKCILDKQIDKDLIKSLGD